MEGERRRPGEGEEKKGGRGEKKGGGRGKEGWKGGEEGLKEEVKKAG